MTTDATAGQTGGTTGAAASAAELLKGGTGADGGGSKAGDAGGGTGGGVGAGDTTAEPWYSKLLPETDHGFVANKNWTDPSAMLASYKSLESLLGADKAGRAIIPPKEGDPPEAKRAFWEKLGAPKEAKDYELKAPEGMAEFPALTKAADWFQKAGVPKELAQSVFNAAVQDEIAQAEEFKAQSQREMSELAKDWGKDFNNNVEIARRAQKAAGLSQEEIVAMENALGTKKFMTVLNSFGKAIAEAPGPGTTDGAGGQFRDTPQIAKQKIASLYADSEFMARYTSPNIGIRKTAIEQMEALQKAAAGA